MLVQLVKNRYSLKLNTEYFCLLYGHNISTLKMFPFSSTYPSAKFQLNILQHWPNCLVRISNPFEQTFQIGNNLLFWSPKLSPIELFSSNPVFDVHLQSSVSKCLGRIRRQFITNAGGGAIPVVDVIKLVLEEI